MKLDAQLLKWNRDSSGGFMVKLCFADEDAAQRYFQTKTEKKGKRAGQLFAVEFTELDDFGNVPQAPKRFQFGEIARWLMVTTDGDKRFYEWLSSVVKRPIENHHAASAAQKQILEIESRKLIDGNEELEARFNERIRIPYMEWLKAGIEAVIDEAAQ